MGVCRGQGAWRPSERRWHRRGDQEHRGVTADVSRSLMLVLLFGATSASVHPQDRWSVADEEIVRLAPAAFEKVPAAIRKALSDLGCSIPQAWGNAVGNNDQGCSIPPPGGSDRPHNVVSGEFMEAGRTQWAGLCSRNRSSAIIVIDENGRVRAELASAPDRRYLQGIGCGKIAYSRWLSPAGADYILSVYQAYGGPKPPLIDHQGIDNAFLEKGSTVHYFHEGTWLRLTGAD